MDVAQVSKEGFQKGEFYDKYRPCYTEDTVENILDILKNIKPHSSHSKGDKYDIVELGAGTGKFTKIISQKMNGGKGGYLAIDPSIGFLETLRKNCPEVKTVQCTASSIPLPDSSVKIILCVQCFHWFATPDSLKEISRVLTPDGALVLVMAKLNSSIPMLNELIEKVYAHLPVQLPEPPANFIHDEWLDVFNEFKGFKLVEERKIYKQKVAGNLDFILDYFTSYSFVARSSDEEQTVIKDEIKEILTKYQQNNGHIELPSFEHIFIFKKAA